MNEQQTTLVSSLLIYEFELRIVKKIRPRLLIQKEWRIRCKARDQDVVYSGLLGNLRLFNQPPFMFASRFHREFEWERMTNNADTWITSTKKDEISLYHIIPDVNLGLTSIGRPLSSSAGQISNTLRIDAMEIHTCASPMWRPGQNLRPYPKAEESLSVGQRCCNSHFSLSPMKRSGIKHSGSGHACGSCRIRLRRWWGVVVWAKQVGTNQEFPTTVVPAGIKYPLNSSFWVTMWGNPNKESVTAANLSTTTTHLEAPLDSS